MYQGLAIFIVGCTLASLPSIGADIYVPSLNSMAMDLHASVDGIQFSMAILMLGIALSQLVYGPVSEGVGRKPALCFGLVLSITGAYGCVQARSLNDLVFAQGFLGLGLGCGSLFRCLFTDSYHGKQLRVRNAYASFLCSVMIPCAPLLGGYLAEIFYWQASFAAVGFLSFITLIGIIFSIPETNLHCHPERLSLAYAMRMFSLVLSHAPFVGYSACTLLTMAGFFSWIAVTPVFFVGILGWSQVDFAWTISLVSLASMFFGNALNNIAMNHYSVSFILKSCWTCMATSSIILASSYALHGFNAPVLIGCMLLFNFATAPLWPNYVTLAFAPFHKQSGYANAVYGSMQVLGSSLAAFVLAKAPESTPYPLAAWLFTTTCCCWILYDYAVTTDNSIEPA